MIGQGHIEHDVVPKAVVGPDQTVMVSKLTVLLYDDDAEDPDKREIAICMIGPLSHFQRGHGVRVKMDFSIINAEYADSPNRPHVIQGFSGVATTEAGQRMFSPLSIMGCHADSDGDCFWPACPQKRDGEPAKSGRHCPLQGEPT